MPQPIIAIHLDLKYIMPSQDYLRHWVRQLPRWGCNTLLLEYEDKFPFRKYPFVRGEAAFKPEELRSFLAICRSAGLRVVPLVQTLSHLEFALAHPQLAHLREAPHVPTQINPENPQAIEFVHELIEEVLEYHQDDAFFHLGADEAWHMGHSPAGAAKLAKLSPLGYWARHVRQFVDQVRAAGKRAWVWDDILWNEPDQVFNLGLPNDTVLVSWNYNKTALNPDGSTFRRVDAYRNAGFDVLGAPCLNWGLLTPQHQHCLDNTATWAQKVRQADLQGIVNTAWACFHVLLHTQPLYIAATARACTEGRSAIGEAWQERFLGEHFGVDAQGLPQALEDLGTLWEQDVKLPRAISPVLFGYMDMILSYRHGQQDRVDQGIYPLDWHQIDIDQVFRRKIELVRECVAASELQEKLQSLQETYGRAAVFLSQFCGQAQANQAEARFLAVASDAKLQSVRILQHLLNGDGDRETLRERWQDLGKALEASLRPFVDVRDLWRPMRLWWESTSRALR